MEGFFSMAPVLPQKVLVSEGREGRVSRCHLVTAATHPRLSPDKV